MGILNVLIVLLLFVMPACKKKVPLAEIVTKEEGKIFKKGLLFRFKEEMTW